MTYVEDVARRISDKLAARLGIAPPPDAWQAFAAQVANETAHGDPSTRGVRNNNPLNLTDAGGLIVWPGQVGRDEAFAVFGTTEQGIDASVQNLLADNYSGVRSAFARGDPRQLARAIQDSPWDAGHYGYALDQAVSGGDTSTGPPIVDWASQAAAIDEAQRRGERNTNPAPNVAATPDCPMGYHYDAASGLCKSWVPGGIVPDVPIGKYIPVSGDEAAKKTLDPIIGDAVKSALDTALGPVGGAITASTNQLVSGAFTLAVGAAVVIVVVLIAVKGVDQIAS